MGANEGSDPAGALVDFAEREVLQEAHAEGCGEGIARADGVDDFGGKAGVVGGFTGGDEQTPLTSPRVGDEAEVEHLAQGLELVEHLAGEIEKTGERLRSLMPWIQKKNLKGAQAAYNS